jgi:hypothetical protein
MLGNRRSRARSLSFFFLSHGLRAPARVRPFIIPLHNKYRLKATVLALPIGKVDIGKVEGENDYDALCDAYYHGI